MAMRRPFAADEAGAERANPQIVQSRHRRGLNHGMGREPQIIVIGETDEPPAVYSGLPPQSVDRREKRVPAVEVSLSSEPEPLRGIFGEAVELLHFAFGGPAGVTKRLESSACPGGGISRAASWRSWIAPIQYERIVA